MSRANQPAPAVVSQMGLFTPRALVDLLFPKAAHQLNHADLLAIIRGGADFAQDAAGHAADVAEGLGCLVAHDASNGPGAGNFQTGASASGLLFHMRDQFHALEGVSAAVTWAASELSARGGK